MIRAAWIYQIRGSKHRRGHRSTFVTRSCKQAKWSFPTNQRFAFEFCTPPTSAPIFRSPHCPCGHQSWHKRKRMITTHGLMYCTIIFHGKHPQQRHSSSFFRLQSELNQGSGDRSRVVCYYGAPVRCTPVQACMQNAISNYATALKINVDFSD